MQPMTTDHLTHMQSNVLPLPVGYSKSKQLLRAKLIKCVKNRNVSECTGFDNDMTSL